MFMEYTKDFQHLVCQLHTIALERQAQLERQRTEAKNELSSQFAYLRNALVDTVSDGIRLTSFSAVVSMESVHVDLNQNVLEFIGSVLFVDKKYELNEPTSRKVQFQVSIKIRPFHVLLNGQSVHDGSNIDLANDPDIWSRLFISLYGEKNLGAFALSEVTGIDQSTFDVDF